jgi:hypothetical protein
MIPVSKYQYRPPTTVMSPTTPTFGRLGPACQPQGYIEEAKLTHLNHLISLLNQNYYLSQLV